MNEERLFVSRMKELAQTAYRQNRYQFSHFLTPAELTALQGMEGELRFVDYDTYGGNECCERQMARFGSREDLVEQMPEWEDEKAGRDFLEQEYKEEVDTILSYLKEEDAQIFRLIYLDGLSMDEVAKRMNMSKTVIYGRISRGRKQIRRVAGESGV